MTGLSPGSLDLLERRAHDGWMVRSPRLPGERVGQPGRQQTRRDGNPVQGAQRRAEAFDHRLARVRVRHWPRLVQSSSGQAFGDVPRPVRAVAVTEVPGVWDLAAGEPLDDRSLVAKRVAKLSIAQSHDDFVADPYAANPAALWKKAPGCWQPSGRQRPQEGWVRGRLVDKRC